MALTKALLAKLPICSHCNRKMTKRREMFILCDQKHYCVPCFEKVNPWPNRPDYRLRGPIRT
jgi:hypothetical protein